MSFLGAADLSAPMISRYLQALKDQHTRWSEAFLLQATDLSRWNLAIARHMACVRPPIVLISADMVLHLLYL
jgi:hypothetical protein